MFTEKQLERFSLNLHDLGWADILALQNTNKVLGEFLNIFSACFK